MVDNLVVDVDGAEVGDPRRPRRRASTAGCCVTCLWYIREVDPQTLLLTGLTRDGVYLVEDGEITGAVNNFRFNESPIDLLDRFSAGVADGAVVLARVGRLLPAHGDAGPPRARLQHVDGQPGPVTAVTGRPPGIGASGS